jgi:3-oxoacyl-[acyl-carrier protein] reductase
MFSLHGKTALLIGYDGKLGPIWASTLETAGAGVYGFGLPEINFLEQTVDITMMDAPDITPDIIVCNAAIDTPPSRIEARFFTNIEDTIYVNLFMHMRIIDFYVYRMMDKGGGVIVLIGSIQGYVGADWRNYSGGFEKPVAYNLSKAALKQLARSLTVQYGRFGIRAVCPGFGPVDTGKLPQEFKEKITDQIPTRRMVSELSLRQTLLYACCCRDLAGEDWLVDGGYTKW